MKHIPFLLVCISIMVTCTVEASVSDQNAQLIKAVEDGSLSAVQAAVAAGADVNAKKSFGNSVGDSVLWLASSEGYLEIVKFLLENKATVDIDKINNGNTALSVACRAGHVDVVKHLIEKNADINVVAFEERATPLMRAVQGNHADVVKLLLEYRANVDVINYEGITALMYARKKGYTIIVRLFENPKAALYSIRPTGLFTTQIEYTGAFWTTNDTSCSFQFLLECEVAGKKKYVGFDCATVKQGLGPSIFMSADKTKMFYFSMAGFTTGSKIAMGPIVEAFPVCDAKTLNPLTPEEEKTLTYNPNPDLNIIWKAWCLASIDSRKQMIALLKDGNESARERAVYTLAPLLGTDVDKALEAAQSDVANKVVSKAREVVAARKALTQRATEPTNQMPKTQRKDKKAGH